MTRRQIYQFIAELRLRFETRVLLDACMKAMRLIRGMPGRRDALVGELLDNSEFLRVLQADDALGQIYQAINAPLLEEAYRRARRQRRKFDGPDIPAVTQLFTPRWVVEFLLHNTLGRAWRQMHPDSGIELPWLIDRPESGIVPLRQVRAFKVLDPACGTMNFGLIAVELLEAMYREELTCAGRAGWPAQPSVCSLDQIAPSILQHNLFGIDIDSLALNLARATLEMKLRVPLPVDSVNLRCADALFNEVPREFDVIVTNPPYLSARNLPTAAVQRLKRAYPASWRDACTCFIDRSLDLLNEGGRAGVLAMQSFMFTGAFERLRERLDHLTAIETIAHFGGGLFDVGNPGTLQTAAVVVRRESREAFRARQRTIAFRLTDAANKSAALSGRAGMYEIAQSELTASPRRAWTYWLGDDVRRTLRTHPRLAKVSPPRQGLATTDNARFVRYWWEVEFDRGSKDAAAGDSGRWFPYAKGGRFRRWYEAARHRVDWADDGAAIKRSIVERYPYLNGKWAWVAKNSSLYGRAGVTYSYLTSGRFSARRLEEGTIFDVAGSALFPEDALTLLGILNSSTAAVLLGAINPTVNFQVGDLGQLPIPTHTDDELRDLVSRAIDLQRKLDTFDQTTTDFIAPMPWLAADDIWHEIHRELWRIEFRIDGLVARLYGINPPPRSQEDQAAPVDRVELARQWVSDALNWVLGTNDEPFVVVRPMDANLLERVRQCLRTRAGPLAAERIDQALGSIERFIERDFFPWHVRRFQRRPVLWVLGNERRQFMMAHHRATREVMRSLLAELKGGAVPGSWDRFMDDGIAINLSPLRAWICEPSLRASLEKTNNDMLDGRFDWSDTAAAITTGGLAQVSC